MDEKFLRGKPQMTNMTVLLDWIERKKKKTHNFTMMIWESVVL